MMHNWYTNVLHAGLISLTNKYVKAAFQRVKHGHKILSAAWGKLGQQHTYDKVDLRVPVAHFRDDDHQEVNALTVNQT